MANPEFTFFNSFPSSQHITDVCGFMNDDKTTCRYLAIGRRFSCEKQGELRGIIDYRFEDENNPSTSTGDNCEGTMGFIRDNKDRLIGKKVLFENPTRSVTEEGALEDITVDENQFALLAKAASMHASKDEVRIEITSSGIVFGELGLESGQSKILFEKL